MWEPLIEERVSSGGSAVSVGGVYKLCSLHRSSTIAHWTVVEMFLLLFWLEETITSHFSCLVCYLMGFWREGVVEKQFGGGVPGWISVFHEGAPPAGPVIREEAAWHRERHGVLLSAGLFYMLTCICLKYVSWPMSRGVVIVGVVKILSFVAVVPVYCSDYAWASDVGWEVFPSYGRDDDSWVGSAWFPALRAAFRQELFLGGYINWVCQHILQHYYQCCLWTLEPRG